MTENQVTPFNNDTEYVARQIQQYEDRQAVLQEIINVGARVRATATGHEQLDLRTCTCHSFGSRRKEHAEDCAVQIVTDSLPVISAVKEMRLNDSYLDDLRASLKPDETAADIIVRIGALNEENRLLRSRVGELEAQLRRESRALTAPNGHRGY